MKRIKLFENFNELDPKEIVADIETIIYELEEKEYDVEISYETDGGPNAMFGLSPNRIVISPAYKKSPKTRKYLQGLMTKNSQEGNFVDNFTLNDFEKDMNIFINQLREHLDYISPEKINLIYNEHFSVKYSFEIRIDLLQENK
jgi:hypothetical protein